MYNFGGGPAGWFSDEITCKGAEYAVYYRMIGAEDDGVTLGVHIDQLPDIPEWLPGGGFSHLAQRAECLLRSFPRIARLSPAYQPKAAYFAELRHGLEPDGRGGKLAELWKGNGDARLLFDMNCSRSWLRKYGCDDEGKSLPWARMLWN
ncbi:MAG: hypothetical protein ACLT8C_05915 [Akkermansia muciniphila]